MTVKLNTIIASGLRFAWGYLLSKSALTNHKNTISDIGKGRKGVAYQQNKAGYSEEIPARKQDHIRINLQEDVQSLAQTGLDDYSFEHQALPEIDLHTIQFSQKLFDKTVQLPFLISSMTGGTREAWQINQKLATAAQEFGLAMAVGSQRAAIENPETEFSFKVRNVAPDSLLFANLGAVQLNYGYSIAECQRAVDMIEADALILHLNPLQEALQPEGETNFSGLLSKIEHVCNSIKVPVIVKEVGWGISSNAARRLIDAGVAAIDVAGKGGTSWAKVESHRSTDDTMKAVAESFFDWGISTADSIKNVRSLNSNTIIFASGGIRHGVDAAKCISMGASLVGFAGKFLKAAVDTEDALQRLCTQLTHELKICMFVVGARNLNELKLTPLKENNRPNHA